VVRPAKLLGECLDRDALRCGGLGPDLFTRTRAGVAFRPARCLGDRGRQCRGRAAGRLVLGEFVLDLFPTRAEILDQLIADARELEDPVVADAVDRKAENFELVRERGVILRAGRHLPIAQDLGMDRSDSPIRARGEVENDGVGVKIRIAEGAPIGMFGWAAFAMLEQGGRERDRLERRAALAPARPDRFALDDGEGCADGTFLRGRDSDPKLLTGEGPGQRNGTRRAESDVEGGDAVGPAALRQQGLAIDAQARVEALECDAFDLRAVHEPEIAARRMPTPRRFDGAEIILGSAEIVGACCGWIPGSDQDGLRDRRPLN